MSTYIGIKKKNKIIKLIEYLDDGSIENLGITLYDYFKDISTVKHIVKTTVDLIEDEDIIHDLVEDDEGYVFEEYENIDDFLESVDNHNIYYIFSDVWFVIGQTISELTELETVLEELN